MRAGAGSDAPRSSGLQHAHKEKAAAENEVIRKLEHLPVNGGSTPRQAFLASRPSFGLSREVSGDPIGGITSVECRLHVHGDRPPGHIPVTRLIGKPAAYRMFESG